MLEMLWSGLLTCLSPINVLALVISVALGIVVGALPGFGAAIGMIIILPLTYTMDHSTALIALSGVYVGCEYGGSISSILLNTPGTSAAMVTAFDGYPMARKGKARDALLISNIASFSGGMMSALAMLLFMPLLAPFVIKFGAAELFLCGQPPLHLRQHRPHGRHSLHSRHARHLLPAQHAEHGACPHLRRAGTDSL